MNKTPMMQQYDRAKAECGDALLLFRMGDFYELFHQDAETAAKVLGLTLTSRDKSKNAIAMAGFPHHQLDSYLSKLIKQGFRVAVCEQVEDPKTAKGLVKREISQIVSPGTITDETLLEPTENNYLAAIVPATKKGNEQAVFGVAWLDLSTGRFFLTRAEEQTLVDVLTRLNISEVLVEESQQSQMVAYCDANKLTSRPKWAMSQKHALEVLLAHFQVLTLDGYGIEESDQLAVRAAGSILQYVQETQNSTLGHIDHLEKFAIHDFVEIDQATWRSLEINRTMRSNAQAGSLFSVMNQSVTAMGSRQLGAWLTAPLCREEAIAKRQEAVEELVHNAQLRQGIRKELSRVFDLQRLVGRVTTGRCAPRDLSAIARTLAALPDLKNIMDGRQSLWLQELHCEMDLCGELRGELERALEDPCPAQLKDGGFIRLGFNAQLDQLRQLAAGGKQWIANYQQTICEETGIPSLKVGFNKVFGYYLEVTHTHSTKVPENFIRKQTLKNAERYITPELKEYEEKVLSADEEAQSLETQLFDALRELARSYTTRLKSLAQVIATLDAVAGLAQLAASHGYCRPELSAAPELHVVDGRHPVLDILQPTGAFVPNDTTIDDTGGFVHLITGPNMAGKSTYIRQVALMTLMAQIGSFVPARQFRWKPVDRIFARIGASDELTRGQSTFMVEMTETARILNTATENSLVILDEIGRGTSTYDGVSLAWSIVEFIHDHMGCRTLFATHYHELTQLESSFSGVRNYNVSVREWEDQIVFLHKIVPGAADKSYGIQVAKLAGVPDWVNRRAEQILKRLESDSDRDADEALVSRATQSRSQQGMQMTLFEIADHPLIEKIRNLDANQVSPMKALEMLHQWKSDIDNGQ